MRLHQPEWLLSLFILPLLAFIFWLTRRKRGQAWKKLLAARLQNRLSRVRAVWLSYLSFATALFGLSLLIIALAQPESGEEWIEVESEGRNILLCIDISRSMLASDVQPDRLRATRAAALEILEKFPNDRIGVILYAGENLIQSPLTLDHSFVEQTLAQLDPADIPYGGSDLSAALNDGTRLLIESGQKSNIMVVLSDGESSTSEVKDAAQNAAKEGIFIYALGMGSPDGSFIPDPRQADGKFRDRRGQPVFTQLNETVLQEIAEITQGVYSRGMGPDFLQKLDSALNEMDRFQEKGQHERVAKPAHRWFLLSGLFLLMLSILVRVLPLRAGVLLLTCYFTCHEANADMIDEGRGALQKGDTMRAHQLFQKAAKETSENRATQLQLAAGSAAFQAKNWEAAANSFSEALSTTDLHLQQEAHYGLATSLFYLGIPLKDVERIKAWKGAVKHYEAALELDSNHSASSENLARVRKFLNQEEKKQQKKKNEEKKKEDQKSQDKQENKKDEQGGEEQKQEKKNSSEKDGDKKSDQQNQQKGDDKKKPDSPPKGEQEKGNSQNENPENNNPSQEPPNQQTGQEQSPQNHEGKQNENQPADSSGQKTQGNLEATPLNESREERARRLLKQYTDFGGKAPRRMRKPFHRPAQDW